MTLTRKIKKMSDRKTFNFTGNKPNTKGVIQLKSFMWFVWITEHMDLFCIFKCIFLIRYIFCNHVIQKGII